MNLTAALIATAVQITAADYNGHSFDGAPVIPVNGEPIMPEWFFNALKDGVIKVDSPRNTDYAEFGVCANDGRMVWAGPGDFIVNVDGRPVIIPAKDWTGPRPA